MFLHTICRLKLSVGLSSKGWENELSPQWAGPRKQNKYAFGHDDKMRYSSCLSESVEITFSWNTYHLDMYYNTCLKEHFAVVYL